MRCVSSDAVAKMWCHQFAVLWGFGVGEHPVFTSLRKKNSRVKHKALFWGLMRTSGPDELTEMASLVQVSMMGCSRLSNSVMSNCVSSRSFWVCCSIAKAMAAVTCSYIEINIYWSTLFLWCHPPNLCSHSSLFSLQLLEAGSCYISWERRARLRYFSRKVLIHQTNNLSWPQKKSLLVSRLLRNSDFTTKMFINTQHTGIKLPGVKIVLLSLLYSLFHSVPVWACADAAPAAADSTGSVGWAHQWRAQQVVVLEGERSSASVGEGYPPHLWRRGCICLQGKEKTDRK